MGRKKREVLERTKVVLPMAMVGWGGAQSSRKEIGFQITDFLDSPSTGYGQYLFKANQNLLSSGSGDVPALRVVSVAMYALPRFALDTSTSSALILFGVPIKQGSASSCGAQCSTLVLPAADARWIPVGRWQASSLLKDSNVQLLAGSGVTSDSVALATYAVLDPDGFTPITDLDVQFKFVIEVAQPLPLQAQVEVNSYTTTVPEWNTIFAATSGVAPEPCLVEATNLRDAM